MEKFRYNIAAVVGRVLGFCSFVGIGIGGAEN
jgi:hypothetical protein